MSMKNSNDTIGNLTRDLPACSAMPQLTAPPRAPVQMIQGSKLTLWLHYCSWLDNPNRPGPHFWGSLITSRLTTLGRTPVDEWSARRRDVYRTTYNTRQTSMPLGGFEPATSASERLQTHALVRARSPASATNTCGYLTRWLYWLRWVRQVMHAEFLWGNILKTNVQDPERVGWRGKY